MAGPTYYASLSAPASAFLTSLLQAWLLVQDSGPPLLQQVVLEKVDVQVVQSFEKVVGEVRQVKEMLDEKVVEEVSSPDVVEDTEEVKVDNITDEPVNNWDGIVTTMDQTKDKDKDAKMKEDEDDAIHVVEPPEEFTERTKDAKSSDVVMNPKEKPVKSLIQKYNDISKSSDDLNTSKGSGRINENMHHDGVKTAAKMYVGKPLHIKKGMKVDANPTTQSTQKKAKLETNMTKVGGHHPEMITTFLFPAEQVFTNESPHWTLLQTTIASRANYSAKVGLLLYNCTPKVVLWVKNKLTMHSGFFL